MSGSSLYTVVVDFEENNHTADDYMNDCSTHTRSPGTWKFTMVSIFSKVWINRVWLLILLVVSCEQEKNVFPCPRSRLGN